MSCVTPAGMTCPEVQIQDGVLAERRARMRNLDRVLKRLFPDAHIALTYSTPWELVVAVILSAQCTDVMVNKVTARLFRKYPTLDAYVHADPETFAQDIHSTGFFRVKAKHILAAARMVQGTYHGRVPCTMGDLLTLPGVARKTANVVLVNACGRAEGIAVDTHVRRFAIRFGLVDATDPVRIEIELMRLVPRKEWGSFTYRVIEYGRTIAPARPYDTTRDPLVTLYPPAGKVFRV